MIWLGLVWNPVKHCRLFNAKFFLYLYIKYIWFGLVWFGSQSTIVGYSMSNTLNMYDLVWFGLVWFDCLSTIVGYSIPNLLYIYIYIYDLVWFGLVWFDSLSTIVVYLILKSGMVDHVWKQKGNHLPLSYLPNPSAREGYDTRSIFKGSLTGLNSEFPFS